MCMQPRQTTSSPASVAPARRLALAIAALGIVLAPQVAEAQRPRAGRLASRLSTPAPAPAIGIRSGYDFDGDAWSLGAQARLPVGRRLEFIPSGDGFLAGNRSDWQLNADLALRLGRLRTLYIGAGLAVLNREADPAEGSQTWLATNLLAGLQPRARRLPVRPFVEVRWTLVDGEAPVRLAFGANLPLRTAPGR